MSFKVVLVSLQCSEVPVAVTAVQRGFCINQNEYVQTFFCRNLELMVFWAGFFQATFATGMSVENKDLNSILKCSSEHCELLNSS